MATRQGYLWKRAAVGSAPPAMQRVCCVLAGTTLWDFDTEEEAALGLRPRCEVDVIGVSPWDGKARYQNYAFGLLFLSSLGTTFHAVAQSKDDLESWLSAMRIGLQAKFVGAHPTPHVPADPPAKRDADVCGISGQPLGRANAKAFCTSCGGAFGQEYCCEDVPLLHFKLQQGARVCRNCFLAQYFLNHLKLLNATLRTHLHELEMEGRDVPDKPSARIRLFRHHSKEAVLAWQLLDGGKIDVKEFSELLRADLRMKDERLNTSLAEFRTDLDRVAGDDAIALLRHLFELRDDAQPLKYAIVLHKLLELSDVNIRAVDFVLPQLLHVFVLMSDRGLSQVLQLEALEEFIVRICSKSPAHVALRVVWAMMAYYEDTLQTTTPSLLLSRRARIIRLTLHVEAAVRGSTSDINEDILHIFTIPSPAQLELIRREWFSVQDCRKHFLLRPFPPVTAFRKMHGQIEGDDEADGMGPSLETSTTVEDDSSREADAPEGTSPPGASSFSFATQIKFVKELTDTAESLRHIDMSLRKETLRNTLQRVQEQYLDVYFPITGIDGDMPKIIRVCADEGAVFRSKARVPVLVCFEVMRPVAVEVAQTRQQPSLSRGRTSSLDYISEQEVGHLLDKGAFHKRMNSLAISEMPAEVLSDDNSESESRARNATMTFDLTEEPLPSPGPTAVTPSMLEQTNASKAPRAHSEYATVDEVHQLVLNRRKRLGGNGLRRSAVSSRGLDGQQEPPQEAGAEGGGGGINMAKLIEQYEARCAQDDPLQGSKNMSPAVASAIEEFKKGNLSEEELEMLVAKDQRFRQHIHETSILDVQFFVSLAFGESWANKKARVKAASPDGGREGWDLLSMIVKSNDDLRQEVCIVQLIELCRDIFTEAGLELWLEPYGIISTTSSTGLIETLTDALSLDALKKKDGYVSLAHHFDVTYGHDKARLAQAKRNFISSLAAYSLVCYAFLIKDRHNGNILLDTEGHVVHIDYGFILGIAPGGSFSLETAPFKLTTEMVDVMGGVDSPLFDEFITLFACGFFALQMNVERLVALVDIMAEQSRFPCFSANDKQTIVHRLRQRVQAGKGQAAVNKNDTLSFTLDLITQSYNSLGTRQYDSFQYWQNDTMA